MRWRNFSKAKPPPLDLTCRPHTQDPMVVRDGYSVGDAQAPLPDDLERTMCQLCTFLTEVEFIAGDAPGVWLPEVKAEYHEIKPFLMSQMMGEARHPDVLRKRALANGGGLSLRG